MDLLSPLQLILLLVISGHHQGEVGSENDLMGIVEGVEIGQIPGILSLAPGMLPPVPPGFFSLVTDPNFFK